MIWVTKTRVLIRFYVPHINAYLWLINNKNSLEKEDIVLQKLISHQCCHHLRMKPDQQFLYSTWQLKKVSLFYLQAP